METRLDRLFKLLDTGSTLMIRKSAAGQLGQVYKQYPNQLSYLLNKILSFMKSKNWDTRIAAGLAVDALLSQLGVLASPGQADMVMDIEQSISVEITHPFDEFDITTILDDGATLLSGGAELFDQKANDISEEDRIRRERELLSQTLNAGPIKSDDMELFDDEDFKVVEGSSSKTLDKRQITEMITQHMKAQGMSSREINTARRKAKMQLKRTVSTQSNGSPSATPTTKMPKISNVAVDQPGQPDKVLIDSVLDSPTIDKENEASCIMTFTEAALSELFNTNWEVRHGSVTILREVVKRYGRYAGTFGTTDQTDENQIWLENTAIKLVCLLALDRFGDYISDEVVAPVRETAAQCLGTLSSFLQPDAVCKLVKLLVQLHDSYSGTWEIQYSAVLGFKYIMPIRQDVVGEILKMTWPLLTKLIESSMDDVRAVSSSCLLPVTEELLTHIPRLRSEMTSPQDFISIDAFVRKLWGSLSELDDLTSSTHGVMSLLSSLITAQPACLVNYTVEEMSRWISNLLMFMNHSSLTVRKSALTTMLSLTRQENGFWTNPHCKQLHEMILRHCYERVILEPEPSLIPLVEQTWRSLVEIISPELMVYPDGKLNQFIYIACHLLMQAQGQPIEPTLLLQSKGEEKSSFKYIAGTASDKPSIMELKVTNSVLAASRCVGILLANVADRLTSPLRDLAVVQLFQMFIDNHLSIEWGKFARQRTGAALILESWAANSREESPIFTHQGVLHCLLRAAEANIIYNEVSHLFTQLQTDCKNFLALLKHHKASLEHLYPSTQVFTVDVAQKLASTDFEQVKHLLKPLHQNKLAEQATHLLNTTAVTKSEFLLHKNRVQTAIAMALVALKQLPPKLNPIIRPLVETIKSDNHPVFLEKTGKVLAVVLRLCLPRQPCPNGKVFKNLCAALCSNPNRTPDPLKIQFTAADCAALECGKEDGILALFLHSKIAAAQQSLASGKSTRYGKGKDASNQESEEKPGPDAGAESALKVILTDLAEDLLKVVPTAEEQYLTGLDIPVTEETAVTVVQALQVIEALYSNLPNMAQQQVLSRVDSIIESCLKNDLTALRHMAARCISACAEVATGKTMCSVLEKIVPLIDASHNTRWRQGAVETIYYIVERLEIKCVPYIVLLIVPILGRMTDIDLSVQMMSSLSFASLIKLMPLEGSVADPPDLSPEFLDKRSKEREFLDQLLNGKPLDDYGIPIPIKAELRKYQQDGVNWLAFLNKYKLHGILCDDMGLGKTLQSICIISGDNFMRQRKYEASKSPDSVPLPSLIVCPSTLCAHWVYEVEKFVDRQHLRALNYSAPSAERVRLRELFPQYSLIVASYEIVRNDIDFLKTVKWNYCVLDEGHIIKNSKSKTTKSAKQLHCNHRLILTGTPIQNNVLELWSLFDFLMPGYLGTERQFSLKYSRPILQSKDSKSTPKQQEQAALAIESLHKQVLPFLLRRLKTDVLQDLPPKIIQDYYCNLTPLQSQLYNQFSQSTAGKSVALTLTTSDAQSQDQPAAKGHIFQALQYLKKVCNHPALVVNSVHPRYQEITSQLKAEGSHISDIKHSAKIASLRQLLLDCGIGTEQNTIGEDVVNQHRALLFFQHKPMMEIVEQDLFKKLMPTVTYLRLDGSVPANSRHHIVNRFNDDPSIDLLLLTTTVGGLGLNLTGADTVIFFEHDWNPMKDLQAMDRAHRIGQTRVVNVYRLITKDTLEEKIMGLQKFKLNIANTVVNHENSSLASMATDQLLDLFSLENPSTSSPAKTNSLSKGLQSMLQTMTELWDESEYESEYDINTFLASLSK